jgi:hypothetical protein
MKMKISAQKNEPAREATKGCDGIFSRRNKQKIYIQEA